jgi:5-formyltetrahydrofolate cyclo-ligase
MMTISNNDLRERIRLAREAQTLLEKMTAAKAATAHLLATTLFFISEHIACYLPVRGELDTRELIEHIWKSGKKCYLPVIDKTRPGYMNFALYCPNDPLIPNEFGILEPTPAASRLSEQQLDLVITPLMAYDYQGNRLGSGCGFYDRVFANKQLWSSRPQLCGFAYSMQQIPQLNVMSWDVPLDAIVTEHGFIVCEQALREFK